MTDKVMFWLGVEFTHFCIAAKLQNLIDAEFFAVIDITEKAKKFFKTQKIVNFKKSWYFFDSVKPSKNNVDFDYLEHFEKKYGINLWRLAINERIFYRFYDFHRFTTHEICSILEQECKLFEKILDEVKPDFLLTKDTSRHHHQLFAEICAKKGIKVIRVSRSLLGNKVILSERSRIFDDLSGINDIQVKNKTLDEMKKHVQSFNFLESVKKSIKPKKNSQLINAAKEYLFSDAEENQEQYYYHGRTKTKVVKHSINSALTSKTRLRFLDKNSVRNPDYSVPFAYFPLHVDMERPLLIGAPFYTNQIEIIRHIVKALPIKFRLYVKESPVGGTREWRKISDYKEILEIPNVTLIHHSVPAQDIFEKCSLVFTVSGTSGFEAAFYNKPTIVFSDVGYQYLPTTHRVDSIEKLSELILHALDAKSDITKLERFLAFMEENTISFDSFRFEDDFNEEFYHGGRLIDVELEPEKIKEFIKSNQKILEKLSIAHIRKMGLKLKN